MGAEPGFEFVVLFVSELVAVGQIFPVADHFGWLVRVRRWLRFCVSWGEELYSSRSRRRSGTNAHVQKSAGSGNADVKATELEAQERRGICRSNKKSESSSSELHCEIRSCEAIDSTETQKSVMAEMTERS